MWRFFRHTSGQVHHDPIEGAFFSTESDEHAARGLIRESIQNSLDAKIEGERARVRFTFGELSGVYAFRLYAGLKRHLSAPGNGLQMPPGPENGLKFLVIEDFGTSGLSGDVEQMKDVANTEENRFYYFWRNVGRTGKEEGTRGTWGLGKTVLPASSRINTFFGLTRRQGDTVPHLMGMSVLKSHQVEGEQYDPYGFFADWRNDEPLPINDPDQVQEFCQNFHVSRREVETGLSIVIPHVVEEFDVDMLREEAVEHYFWPILNGELIIEIQENHLTPPETIVDRSYLVHQIKSRDFRSKYRELADTIELAIRASSRRCKSVATVSQPTSGSASSWENAIWAGDGVDNILKLVAEGEPFGVRVQVSINPKYSRRIVAACMVYGMPVRYRPRKRSYFTRQGVNVVEACQTNPDKYVFLLVPEQGPLSNMLAKAENPSHTKFVRTDVFVQDYAHGAMQTIVFLQNAPRAIAEKLDVEEDEPDRGLFSDMFWKVGRETARRRRTRRKSRNGDTTDPTFNPPPKRLPAFNISQTSRGFRLADSEQRTWGIEYVDVRVAYNSVRGDAFKNHEAWDFDFNNLNRSGLVLETQCCEVQTIEPNRIRLIEIEKGFSLRVVGFDSKRDLAIFARSYRSQPQP